MVGKVKSFNVEKGFGFILIEGGDEVFVHHSALLDGLQQLTAGDQVDFELELGPKGATARDVKLLS